MNTATGTNCLFSKRQVWIVRDLWHDKAKYTNCRQAELTHAYLRDPPHGFACIPYKHRPAIIVTPDGERRDYFLVLTTTTQRTTKGSAPDRIYVGRIGTLSKESFVYVRRPLRFHRDAFTEQHGEMSQLDYTNCLKALEKRGLRCSLGEDSQADELGATFDNRR